LIYKHVIFTSTLAKEGENRKTCDSGYILEGDSALREVRGKTVFETDLLVPLSTRGEGGKVQWEEVHQPR